MIMDNYISRHGEATGNYIITPLGITCALRFLGVRKQNLAGLWPNDLKLGEGG